MKYQQYLMVLTDYKFVSTLAEMQQAFPYGKYGHMKASQLVRKIAMS